MGLAIPTAARDYADKAAYCYRVIELLRLWHNDVGAKVDVKDAKALADFRKWQREEWEPRHKAACFTLHSLAGFSQAVPAEYEAARQKTIVHAILTPAETAALKTVDDRQASKVAAKADASWDALVDLAKIPRLGVAGEPPDPTEDFTTYTEVDPGNDITITSASQIDYAALAENSASYVYKDMGAAHFAGDFAHLGKAQMTSKDSGNYPWVAHWVLSNALGGWRGDLVTNHVLAATLFYNGPSATLSQELDELTVGSPYIYSDCDTAGSLNTPYWFKMVRDEGVGTYGTLYAYYYTDASRTTLLSSQSIALHEAKVDYRYIHALNSCNFNTATMTGFVAELDLQEVPPPTGKPVCADHYYRTARQ